MGARQPPRPQETVVATLGDVAALWHIAGHLELLPLLDSTLPAKRRQQGLSCSQYMVLAAINRVVAPTSKLQFADWYRQTALTRLLPADPAWLSSQNFWNHMNRITADHIAAFEKQMSQQLIQRLKLDCGPWSTTAQISSPTSTPAPQPNSPNAATTSKSAAICDK